MKKKHTEHSSIPTTSTATGVGTSLDSGGSAAWDGQCPVRARWHELCGAGRCGRNGMVGPDGEVGHAGDVGRCGKVVEVQRRNANKKKKRKLSELLFLCNQ
jgi:hypothetical protein